MALVAAPFAAQAETINIYGWQNHSWEFVDVEGGASTDRIQSNAGNIGFSASVDTGLDGIHVNLQCEQFTYYNHFGGGTGWCNRNSKIGLSHPMAGEIMFATWLLPYNEGVAQWVDPFYDAGADSHTSIMGSVGAHTIFYNTGDFDLQASASGPLHGSDASGDSKSGEFNYAVGGYDTGFNRRQENIIQYWSPNWNGFVFRFAWTAGIRDEITALNDHEIDPVIRSSSLAYTNGPFWGAVTWQDHEDWTAASIADADGNPVMEASDAESIRVAGRYIMDLGGGASVQISAMWEDLEYEFNGVVDVDSAMKVFGYGDQFMKSYDLLDDAGNVIQAVPGKSAEDLHKPADTLAQKTLADIHDEFLGAPVDTGNNDLKSITLDATEAARVDGIGVGTYAIPDPVKTVMDNPLTLDTDEGVVGNTMVHIGDYDSTYDTSLGSTDAGYSMTKAIAAQMHDYLLAAQAKGDPAAGATTGYKYKTAYDNLVANATKRAIAGITPQEEVPLKKKRADATAGQNVKIEREAWMVSGKIKFGGPVDFRFSYMDADDLEVSCGSCSGDWNDTAADAWNVGLFYTMPAGTELRLTYSEVDNDNNGTYGQGISGTGLGSPGAEIEMFAVGIVHWFD